jgi:hypothetical protein
MQLIDFFLNTNLIKINIYNYINNFFVKKNFIK